MSGAPEPTGSFDTAIEHANRLLQSDPQLAAEQATEIIRAVGRHPRAVLVLGNAQLRCAQIEAALATLEALVAEQPRWALAQLALGVALGRAGNGERAQAALERAVALKPDLPDAWLALADHRNAIGDHEGADAAYTRHIKASTRDPRLLAAASALVENQIPEAEARLRAHLRESPTDVAALRMFAEVAARLGRQEDAEHLLERCLELAPGFDAARQNYALVLYRSNKPEAALAEIATLLAIEPRNPGYRNLKAIVLGHIGEYTQAIELFGELLAEYPGSAKVWMSYGHALKTAGDTEQSVVAYRKCIALEPGLGEAWWSLANLKTLRFDAADLAAMRAALAREDLADEDRLHFEFAIGKALEDGAEYADSFAHYAEGNRVRRAGIHYSADATSARVQRTLETFTADFFATRAGFGCAARDPIFVVGLPRSGSTLIEQILSSHSAVEGTMELPEIRALGDALRERAEGGDSYHAALAAMDAAQLGTLGESYLERTRIQRKTAAPFFIDKMPNNFMHLGLIHLILPNARIIDARRHPMACCFSGFKQHFARGQHFSYSLPDIGRYYADYVRLMAHFDAVLPRRVHRVFYERMVGDTEVEVRRLLDYCGLPFEAGCLRFFENERPVRTASSEQVRQPIYTGGVEQWHHYEAWLDALKIALGPVLAAYPATPRN